MSNEKRRPILVAEDDTSVRDALGKFLRLRGFDVVSAQTVDEALDAITVHRPRAAVIELELGDASGRDVAVSMPARAPVIIFTSDGAATSQLERLRPRTRLVIKPYSLWLVIDLLEELLEHADGHV